MPGLSVNQFTGSPACVHRFRTTRGLMKRSAAKAAATLDDVAADASAVPSWRLVATGLLVTSAGFF